MRCKNPFRFCLWSSCSQAKKRRSTVLSLKLYGTQFSCFWIISMRLWGIWKWLVESLPMILTILLAFGTSLQQVMLSIRNLRKFSLFHCHVGPRHQITALEALKLLTTRFFTKRSLTVSTWEHSMSLSRSFLQMKAKKQNFPQMTRIWLKNWHLRSRINLWCKYKFTNVVLSLCWKMSKLTVCVFWSAYFDQHLPLQPSIEKRRK